jgi:hypothetical protein
MQQREADLSLGRELLALGRLSEGAAALTVAVESQPDLHSALETCYVRMVERYRNGLAPAAFDAGVA